MPSAGESTYGNASRRSARTNASCSSRAPSLASTIPSQSPSRRAIERSTGRSVLQRGQVGERKKRSVLRPPAPGPPRSCTVPVRSLTRTTGAGSPTAGPFPTMSAPAGATRSWSPPIWAATTSTATTRAAASGTSPAGRRRYSTSVARKRPRSCSLWPAATEKSSASAVRSVTSMTGSMLGGEEQAPGEARLGDLAQHGARHGVVDGDGGRQRRRGDQDRVLVLGDEDALDARVGEDTGEQPACEAAAPRLLSDDAHQRVQHRDALYAPARREIKDPDLAARRLVGVRAALVHEGVEPAGGGVHREVLAT